MNYNFKFGKFYKLCKLLEYLYEKRRKWKYVEWEHPYPRIHTNRNHGKNEEANKEARVHKMCKSDKR